MALIWTRYSTSTETAMDQDITALAKAEPVQAMIENIENEVGRRPVTEQELRDQRKNSPFMLMSYVLAKYEKAHDWFNGMVVGTELYHIFPKSLLGQKYDLRKESKIVDQVANLIFIASLPKKSQTNRPPTHYLPEVDQQHLKVQYVPLQPDFSELNNFEQFMLQRRTMLADATNQPLLSLSDGKQLWPHPVEKALEYRIDRLEQHLRILIAHRLGEVRGESTWEQLVSKDIRNSVEGNIKKDLGDKLYDVGKYGTLDAKLKSSLFSHLFRIIKENWALFQDVFGSENKLNTHAQFILNVRNK